MAQITITTTTINIWQGVGDSIALFVLVNAPFTSSDGGMYPATVERHLPYAGRPASGTCYFSVACEVGGGGSTLTIPAITLPSTTDSPDNPATSYSALLWDTAAGAPLQQFGTFSRWTLQPSYDGSTNITWADVFQNQ